MKKGLVAFLVISISVLLATLALTFIFYNIEIITFTHAPAVSQKPDAENIVQTDAPEQQYDTIPSDAPAQTETPVQTEIPTPTGTPIPTLEPDAKEEPVLPEITPEPDMDPDTWDYIKGGDYNMRYIEKEKAPKVMPYLIKVNKQMNTVTVYEAGKKGKYTKPVKAMICSAGRGTPLGTFKTSDKYYWKAMVHSVWAQYATRITGQILFHSVPYDVPKKDTLITDYYNQLGQIASAGCVRLSVEDAKWIAENCPSGTTVIIYNSPETGPLGKPSAIKIPTGCTWDPTDPDSRNPWNSDKSTIIGVKDTKIERGTHFNIYSGVIGFDKPANLMTSKGIKASKTIDTTKTGTHEITFTFTPSKGKKIKKTATYTVVDTKAPVISGLPSKHYVKDISEVTQKYIFNKINVTDNGRSLSKKNHVSISLTGKTATITAHDDYNHVSKLKVSFIEDFEAPEIVLKSDNSTSFKLSQTLNEKSARKRIKSVKDNETKLSVNDVAISIKPSDWGLKVIYSVKDDAGNKTSVSEIITFETASVKIINPNLVVEDIDDYDTLENNITVISDITGKTVDYEVDANYTPIQPTATHECYSVEYTVIYRCQAGRKKIKTTSVVSIPR